MLRLQTVQKKDRDLLWNINQKYLYEMTNFYDDPMDENGNYHYGHFDDYFSDPKRVAYFIYSDDVLVGFAMLCPYSNIDQKPDYTMAEFTIFPAYRRKHFALDAAEMILDKHPGKWEIKYNEKNGGAKKLWNIVAEPYKPEVYPLNDEETVLSFMTAEKIIAACGNDCAACPRYTAHPYEKTDEELHHTAELWMKIGYRDHVVSNEEIACYGCKLENWCRYRVIKCCVDRGIRTCGECSEYPCENIKECFAVTKSFEPMCRQVCTDDEYKSLERAFFEKEKNLTGKLVKLDPVQKEDIETLWRMQVEAFTELLDKYQDFDTSPAAESIDKTKARFEQPWTKYYFIIVGGIKVGAIRVVDKQDGSRKRISPIWIMPEYRNKGYAQQAILAAEKIYGSDHWCLDTILQEEGNLHLYEKLGYHQTGRVDKINDRMDIVYYEKD